MIFLELHEGFKLVIPNFKGRKVMELFRDRHDIQDKVKLYMFQTGILKYKAKNIKMNGSLNLYKLPTLQYLIMLPKESVIIDGRSAVKCGTNPRKY